MQLACFCLMIGLSGLVSHCATPVQPTGGPPDRIPPEVVYTEPPTGTVMFDGDHIRFHFSKYVNRSSFQDALRLEPDLDLDVDIRWRRRTATVRFNEELPDTTTLIFTIGTDLRDSRNNRMATPFQLALSTGPDIDEGSISARIMDAQTGRGLMGEKIFLYRHPVDLKQTADYVGEADTAGRVRFDYLRGGWYKGFWLDDRNRNRKWDRERETAQPFSVDSLWLEPGGMENIGTVYIDRPDTVAPVLQAVGLLSEVRMRLQFSEEVVIGDHAAIRLQPVNREDTVRAQPLYTDPERPEILFAQTLTPLMEALEYDIEMRGITDNSGNEAVVMNGRIQGSSDPDTTYARVVAHVTRHGILPDEPLVFSYAKIPDPAQFLLDSLTVIVSESRYRPWPAAGFRENMLYVYPADEWQAGEDYQISLWDEERMDYHTYQPVIHHPNRLGGLEIEIQEAEWESRLFRAEVYDEEGIRRAFADFSGQIEFLNLPAGSYVVRVFETSEEDSIWDSGNVDPFRSPALFFIQRDVPVEPGFTGRLHPVWQ